jgi:hypothetical protein
MDLRFFLGLALTSLGGLLTAQAPAAAKPAAPAPAAQGQGTPPTKQEPGKQDPAKQDPDRPGKKPADEIAELQREQDRLQKEIAFVRDRAAMSSRLLSEKFANRKLEVEGIDAGTSAVSAPVVAMQMKRARLMTDEEKRANGDAVLLIDSRPVKDAALDELAAYLKTMPSQTTDEKAAFQRVTLEVIRLNSMLAAVASSVMDAEKQVAEAKEKLAKGTAFADVAKTYNHGPGLPEDGKVTLSHFSRFGLPFEAAAFSAKEGTMLPPIPTMDGFVIAQVDKIVPGDAPERTTLEMHLLQIPYLAEPKDMEQARQRAALGKIDIAVRDEKMFERLPAFLQPLPAPTIAPAKADEPSKAPKVDSAEQDKPKQDKPKADAVKKEPAKVTPPAGGGHEV